MYIDSTSNNGTSELGLNTIDAVISTFGDYISSLQPDERVSFIIGLVNNTNIYTDPPRPSIYKPRHGEVNNIQLISNMLASFYISTYSAYKEVDRVEKATILNYNTSILLYSTILSMMKTANYKLAAFNIYNKIKAKTNIFLESFLDLNNIDYAYPIQTKPCVIDNNMGAAVLPFSGSVTSAKRTVSSVKLSKLSNGTTGSSVSTDGFRHDNVAELFDNNNDTWLEYEKTAASKIDESLNLEFIIKLTTPQIINFMEFTIHPVAGLFPIIDDILVSTTGTVYTSVFNETAKAWVDFPTGGNVTSSNGIYAIPMFPVRALYIKVRLKQNKQYIVRSASKRLYRQVIAIKEIAVYGNKYDKAGSFVSESIDTDKGYNAVGLLANSELFNDKLGLIKFSMSPDDGMTWVNVSDLQKNDTSVDEIVSIEGSSTVRIMTEIERLSDGFSQSTRNKNDTIVPYRQITALPVKAPYFLQLDTEPADEKLLIGIIGVGSVGDDLPRMRIKNIVTRESQVTAPGADQNGMITIQEKSYGRYPGSALLNTSSIDYNSIVVSSEDGTSVIFTEGSDYIVDKTKGSIIFKDSPSSVVIPRTTYGSGQAISLPYSIIDQPSIKVYNSSGGIVSSGYAFDATNNSIIFDTQPSGVSKIVYNSIENIFDTVDVILVTYNRQVRAVNTEYLSEMPTVFYESKDGFYKIFVNSTQYQIISPSSVMTDSNQCKIYYGTNKISFYKDVSGSIVDIGITDEYVVFSKSKPHIGELEITGSGNPDSLYCYTVDKISEVTKTVPVSVDKYLIIDENVIDIIVLDGSTTLTENTDYRVNNNIIYFASNTTTQLTVKYYKEDRVYVDVAYDSDQNDSVTIRDNEFSFSTDRLMSYSIDNTYKKTLSIDVGYGYGYAPQIINGTVSVISVSGITYNEIGFIDGITEFDGYTSTDYVYSVDNRNGVVYFNLNIPTGTQDSEVSIQYEYTLFRVGYDILSPISPNMYSADKKQVIFNELFAKFVDSGVYVDKEIVIRYNIKDVGQPSLADLEQYYTPILFDYSLIFATS